MVMGASLTCRFSLSIAESTLFRYLKSPQQPQQGAKLSDLVFYSNKLLEE
jgi:hypothetical protein